MQHPLPLAAAPDMKPLGRSTLVIPRFGLGTGPLGGLYEAIPAERARATLDTAWDRGVRLYDTAAWYGRGLSEHHVGTLLREKPRADYVLTTKVGRTLHRPADPQRFDRTPWVGGLNFDVCFDYSYDGILRSFDQALQRLGIDTVDALAIHDLDRDFHGVAFDDHRRDLLRSGTRALDELRSQGVVRAIGMGFNLGADIAPFVEEIDLDYALVAHPYTLLDQSSLDSGMAACLARGTSVVIGAPFASGILATGSGAQATYAYGRAPEGIQTRVRGIEAVCAAHSVALPAAALQFPLAHPAVRAVIPGAVSADQIAQNVAAVSSPIPPGFWDDLKSEGLIAAEAPTPR